MLRLRADFPPAVSSAGRPGQPQAESRGGLPSPVASHRCRKGGRGKQSLKHRIVGRGLKSLCPADRPVGHMANDPGGVHTFRSWHGGHSITQ